MRNNPAAPNWQAVGTVTLFAWSGSAREVKDGTKNAEIEDLRALFALAADVRPGDELVNITDRRGTEIIPAACASRDRCSASIRTLRRR
jgi:hypothetical protein